MPLQLNGQNIETPAGDSGTYTWANVLALNSTNMISTTNTNGRPLYRWRGILTLRGTAVLNISKQLIELMRVSTTQRGQFIVQDSAKINIDYCSITAREFYQQFTGGDNGGQRYLLRIESALAEINAYETSFDLGDVSTFSTKAATNIRTEITLSNIRNCSVQGSIPSPIPTGYDGYCLNKLRGDIKNLQLRNVTLETSYTNSTNNFENITTYGGIYGLTNWTYNGLNLRNFVVDGSPASDYFSNTLTFTTFIDCVLNLANGAVMKQDLTLANGEHKKAATHNLKIQDVDGNVSNVLVTYSGRSTLSGTTDANGSLPEFVLIHQETNLQSQPDPGGSFALYPKPLPLVDYSVYTRTIKSYKHLPLTEVLTVGARVGSAINPFQIRLTLDPGVSELNTSIVAAYSGISHTVAGFTVSSVRSIAEVYDSRKLYWRNNSGVIVPTRDGQVANFGLTDVTLSGPTVLSSASKFSGGLATDGIITLQSSGVYSIPVLVTNKVIVNSGQTDLRTWTFDTAILDTNSAGNAIVTVAANQLSNISVANPTAGGGTITLQEPQLTTRLFGIPNVAGAIVMVKDLTTNNVTYPTVMNGETTIVVVSGRSYQVRADAPGYLASRFITFSASNTRELEFSLDDFRSIYDAGVNRSSQIIFNPTTYGITITDDTLSLSFADVFRTLEDYLATSQGMAYTAHPYPVVLPDRNILWFPYDTTAGTLNPARIKPDPTNTADPTLLFEVSLENASDPTFDLFDFSEANGRIIRVRSRVSIANVSVTEGFSAEDRMVINGIATRTTRVDGLIENVSGDRFKAKTLETAPTGSGGSGVTPQQIWEYNTRSLTDKTGFELSVANITAIVSAVWSATTRTLTSAISSFSVADIWSFATRSLTDKSGFAPDANTVASAVDTALQDDFANVSVDLTPVLEAIDALPTASENATEIWSAASRTLTAIDKTGYSLTLEERSNIAATVEAALINESDGRQLINAIVQSINSNLDLPSVELAAIAQSVRSELATELSRIDTTVTSRASQTSVNAIPSAIDTANAVQSALQDDFDNVSVDLTPVTTAIDSLPTLAEIQSVLPDAPDNLSIAAIKAKTDAIVITGGKVEAVVEAQDSVDLTPVLEAIDSLPTGVENAAAVWNAANRTLTAIDKTGYSLTPVERSSIATSVEAALINDGDGQQLIDAILQVINSNLDLPPLELTAIAQAVRSELTTELSRIDATVTSRASQTSVNAIPPAPSSIAIAGEVQSALQDDFANVTIDLSPVVAAIDVLPTLAEIQGVLPPAPNNSGIGLILDKVNEIQIDGDGKVIAAIDQTVDVNAETIETIADAVDGKLEPRFVDLGDEVAVTKDQATIAARNTQS